MFKSDSHVHDTLFSWCNAIAFSRFLALFQMWDFLKGGCLF